MIDGWRDKSASREWFVDLLLDIDSRGALHRLNVGL